LKNFPGENPLESLSLFLQASCCQVNWSLPRTVHSPHHTGSNEVNWGHPRSTQVRDVVTNMPCLSAWLRDVAPPTEWLYDTIR